MELTTAISKYNANDFAWNKTESNLAWQSVNYQSLELSYNKTKTGLAMQKKTCQVRAPVLL